MINKVANAVLVIKDNLSYKKEIRFELLYICYKEKLFSLIKEMDTYHWLFTKNPNTDFSRKKKWSFEEVMKFIITMEGKSLKDELLEDFDFNNDTPSNSSFNQHRAQILPDAFEFLFREFTDFYSTNDETTYFRSIPGTKGFNQLHLNALYDLCARTYMRWMSIPGFFQKIQKVILQGNLK